MSIGIGSTWGEDYLNDLHDKVYLSTLSKKHRKKVLKARKKKYNNFHKALQNQKSSIIVPGRFTPFGPIK